MFFMLVDQLRHQKLGFSCFAIWKNGRVHLFHASSTNKKVEISEKPLAEYLAGNKSQSGVIVCRLVD